ncbi:uncharacterized protein LOC122451481 [Cervus canadensis]|uniref:uncharacterized protein LOC122451481 n=1 Tax=Cervus canadensis TaxID=1574408 RepID=UPI001C9E5755|nr:uncharacterized protein LOC122451481 [Cervus canadensis]
MESGAAAGRDPRFARLGLGRGSAKRFVLHKEKMASPIVFRPFSSGEAARNGDLDLAGTSRSVDGRAVRRGLERRADVAGGWGGGLSLGPCAGASGAQGKGRVGALRCARRSSWGLSAFCGSLVSRTQRAAPDFGSQHLGGKGGTPCGDGWTALEDPLRTRSERSGARNPFSGHEDAAGSGPHLAASAAGAARTATAPPPRLRSRLKPGDSLGTEVEARRLRGLLWGLRARPAPGGLRSHSRALRRPRCRGGRESSLPRTPELEWAFPSRGPRRRGRREKSRCARRLRPAALMAPPVEVNSPHPFLCPARPPSARPRLRQPPDCGRSLRIAHPLRCAALLRTVSPRRAQTRGPRSRAVGKP